MCVCVCVCVCTLLNEKTKSEIHEHGECKGLYRDGREALKRRLGRMAVTEYGAKTRNMWRGNAHMETARHCKRVYECNRSVSTCCHIIHNTEHVDQGEKPEPIASVHKRWPEPTWDPCWSESLTGGGGGSKQKKKPETHYRDSLQVNIKKKGVSCFIMDLRIASMFHITFPTNATIKWFVTVLSKVLCLWQYGLSSENQR
jgi:hypothetical protein